MRLLTTRYAPKLRLVAILLLANILCAQASLYKQDSNSERKISNSPRVDPSSTGTKCSLSTLETSKRNIMSEDMANNVSPLIRLKTSINLRAIFRSSNKESNS